ncbi:MAG: glycerol kinase GlpK [Phycisphaerales bacterium JB040]
MAHLLALDQGTTSSRSIVFREDGSVVSVAQRELTQRFPRPGWVEHDPEEIWSTQRDTMAEALDGAALVEGDLAAIGLTNQRETTLVWERDTGRPIHHAVVWQDRRTADACERLKQQGHEPLITEKTGLLLDPYFSGTKAAWILDRVDGARARAERGELCLGTVDSWLVWRLTGGNGGTGGVHVTDATNASRTLLFNLHTGAWDPVLCELLGVPEAMLPRVVGSVGEVGRVGAGLPGAGVPIAGVLGDQQAALLGQACVRPGLAKNTYGTGCFLVMNTGDRAHVSRERLLSTVAWRVGDTTEYALEGSVFVAGAAVQWLRDGLGLAPTTGEIAAMADSVEDSGGVVVVPAFAGLGAPHWDPSARGLIIGITRGTTAPHLARATVDAMAFQVADVAHAMERDSGRELSELRVDGGAAVNDTLLQTQADLLQRPVVRPACLETTALGAAYAAGLGVGVFPSVGSLTGRWREDRRFEPGISGGESAARMERWRDAVERCRAWEGRAGRA